MADAALAKVAGAAFAGLHGDGRTAHTAPPGDNTGSGAEQRKGIDAGVVPEKSVFVAQYGIYRSRGNIGQTGVDAVFLIGREAHAHDAAAFVEHRA